MLPDRVSNPGPLTYESGALPIALRGPALINVMHALVKFHEYMYIPYSLGAMNPTRFTIWNLVKGK